MASPPVHQIIVNEWSPSKSSIEEGIDDQQQNHSNWSGRVGNKTHQRLSRFIANRTIKRMGHNVQDTSCHFLNCHPAWLLSYKERVNSWQRIDSSHPPKKASNTFFFYAKQMAWVARKLWETAKQSRSSLTLCEERSWMKPHKKRRHQYKQVCTYQLVDWVARFYWSWK